ncbi:hypothetical protein HK100_005305 [Physocladia obscura]|uniref:Uncharacterized protein n=1 Tax=Physocladia obscura TaxID=109957 RepID=A0AAD5X9F2_9FUNG|nr:hypothetical protein HK100_005305 [Physocladia obscura]
MKVHRLSEEVVSLHANKDTLQPFRVRQNSAASSQGGRNYSQQQDQQVDIMMALCRELSSANAKLTLELTETKQMLENNQTEVANMTALIDELQMNDIHLSDISSPPATRHTNYSSSLAQEILGSSFKQSMLQMKPAMMTNSDVDESPSEMGESVSVSSPIFPQNQTFELNNSSVLYDIEKLNMMPPLYPDKSLSPAASASSLGRVLSVGKASKRETAPTTKVLIQSLLSMASSLNSRLSKTDTVAINRRLRRAFDIKELTRLADSVISNIETDISNLSSRFPNNRLSTSAATLSPPSTTTTSGSDYSTIISPTVTLIQTLLTEIAQLRRSMNDLSLAYFEIMSIKAQEHEAAATAAAATVATTGTTSSLEGSNTANASPAVRIQKTIHRMLSNPGSLFLSSSQLQQSLQVLQPSRPPQQQHQQEQNQQEQQPVLSSASSAIATNSTNIHTNSPITSSSMLSSPRQRSVSSPRSQQHIVPASVTPATATAVNISRAPTPIPPTKDENEADESVFDFDPPQDHPYWRQIDSTENSDAATLGTQVATPAISRKNTIGSSSRPLIFAVGNEEAGLSEIPPPDHPYWKSENQLSTRSSKSFFDLFQINKKG